ncbi:hypothetical protein HQ587_01855 [bacterium]|nr:hypothetical protein [bacterium]
MNTQLILTTETALSAVGQLRDIDNGKDFEGIWSSLNQYLRQLYDQLTPIEEFELDRLKRDTRQELLLKY